MRILRKAKTADRVGYSETHIMRLEREGRFPKRVHLGPNAVGFVEDEVDEWLRARIDERDLPSGEAGASSADQQNETADVDETPAAQDSLDDATGVRHVYTKGQAGHKQPLSR